MSYCTLEEAWGSDFKKKKKTKKEKYYEKRGKQQVIESIDPQILVPETHRPFNYRKTISHQPIGDNSTIQGYDLSFDSYVSPYQKYTRKQIEDTNEQIIASQIDNSTQDHSSLIRDIEKPVEQFIQITKQEYDKLKENVIEGFNNQSDEQFNQLLLYIFTGIFYLLMLDMMYHLGKRSY